MSDLDAQYPPFRRTYDAFLFDMDGTLLNSIPAANRIWTSWCIKMGLDPAAVMPHIHGVRAIDTIKRYAPAGVDPEAEAAWVTAAEIADLEGVAPLPGVLRFLESLPPTRWAIVTSASEPLARARLGAAGIPIAPIFVTAEQILHGKPAPDPFLHAAARLGFAASDCLVWEDAPAGIRAGEAAGSDVVVLTATHDHPTDTSHFAVTDYRHLSVQVEADGRLRLHNTL
jgi:sugar-phosphatase